MARLPLNALNFQHLLYFWTVAREGSIARATRSLHLTQATISAQIKTLEQALGARLFQRQGRGLVLSDMGQVVFRFADEIFRSGRQLLDAIEPGAAQEARQLRVGIADTMPKLTTWRLLEPALRRYPDLRLACRTDKLDQLIAELATHSLDLVLADQPGSPTLPVRSHHHLLGESELSVFGASRLVQPLRAGFPSALHGAAFILPSGRSPIRRAVDAWFIAHDLAVRTVCEVEDPALLQVFGQEGMGFFVAPSVVEPQVQRQYGVELLGRLRGARVGFYAIRVERRVEHPAVLALAEAARTLLGD